MHVSRYCHRVTEQPDISTSTQPTDVSTFPPTTADCFPVLPFSVSGTSYPNASATNLIPSTGAGQWLKWPTSPILALHPRYPVPSRVDLHCLCPPGPHARPPSLSCSTAIAPAFVPFPMIFQSLGHKSQHISCPSLLKTFQSLPTLRVKFKLFPSLLGHVLSGPGTLSTLSPHLISFAH